VRAGDEISDLYDPLIAKLVVHDVDREHARRRMLRALEEFVVEGPATLLAFHRALLESPCFVEGRTCLGVVESKALAERTHVLEQLSHGKTTVAPSADGRGLTARARERVVTLEVDGRRHEVRMHVDEPPWAELARRRKERSRGLSAGATGAVRSPMQGTVLSVEVEVGATVRAGDLVCVVEAMKMENEVVSHADGVVAEVGVTAGDQVSNGQVICVIAPS
jgi:acetyl-CoA/propionyl-CoA carboxylase biotin carboxyl carrier protein